MSQDSAFEDQIVNVDDSTPNSPHSETSPDIVSTSDDLTDGNILDVEGDTNTTNNSKFYLLTGTIAKSRFNNAFK